MPDFNPDKERHRKHKFVVQKAWTDASRPNDGLSDGVATSKGVLKPDDEGRMLVNDEALAREIQQENPKELVVTRMNADDPADRGHNYFFSVSKEPLYKIFERWKNAPTVSVSLEEAYKLQESRDFYGFNNYVFDGQPQPLDGEIGYDDNQNARILIERQHREAEAHESQKAQDETPVEVQETKEV